MTITSTSTRVSYTGTNVIGQTMAVTFKFIGSGDLAVFSKVTATDTQTSKLLGVNYTVSGGGGSGGSTGTVTTLDAVPTTETWVIIRLHPLTQSVDYIDNDSFQADTHEGALDKLTMSDQQLQDQINRTLHYPLSESAAVSGQLPVKADRINKYLGFGAGGAPVAVDLETDTTLTTSYSQTLLDDTTAANARTTLELLSSTGSTRPSAGTVGRRFVSSDYGQEFYDNGVAWVETGRPYPDLITNGAMRVNQRVGPFDSTAPQFKNDDDSFTLDHVLLLSDGNNAASVAQATGGAQGFSNHLTATVVTGSKKFGFLFPIENRNIQSAVGSLHALSLSFYAKTDTLDIENVRAHLLHWDGTADAVTSDVVSGWGAEGSNPTFVNPIPGWEAINTAANLTLTNSWTRYKVENIPLFGLTDINNLAVFIHVDDLDLIPGDVFYLTGVMLNSGTLAGDYQHKPFAQELLECQRYFRKSFDYGTEPGQNVSATGAITQACPHTAASSPAALGVSVSFPVPMFVAPTVIYYSTSASNTAWWNATATAQASGGSSTVNVGTGGFFARNAGIDNDDSGDTIQIQYTADGEM